MTIPTNRAPRTLRTLITRDDAGSSLVEVALVMAFFLLPLLVGSMEMATLVFDSIQVQDAARAGAAFAMQSATLAADTADIQAAAQQDAPAFGADLTVTPTTYYVCSATINGTHYSTLSSANANCTGSSNHPLQFVQVEAHTTVTPGLRCPGFGTSFYIAAESAMEIEQ